MPRFNEDTLGGWTRPASDHEEAKLANAERLVREAIGQSNTLTNKPIEIFGQGSYANDTNVRLNSDIDINVCYTGSFYFELPEKKTREDFGLNNPATYTFEQYKNDIEAALVTKFGRASIKRNDKCLTVLATPTRVETDVVPSKKFRRYDEDGDYVEGVKFIADSGRQVINYPLQHIENGKEKNRLTQKRFKRLTRIYRKIRYRMKEDGEFVSDNITSFLLECLVWNVPNNIFNDNDSWSDRLRESIRYLYQQTATKELCNEWGEVSELLYLFRTSRKWRRQEVHDFLGSMWQYLQY